MTTQDGVAANGADSGNKQKSKRGQHPNSLANLVPWTSETAPAPQKRSGPRITPELMKLADAPIADTAHLWFQFIAAKRKRKAETFVAALPEGMTGGQLAALVLWGKAIFDTAWGDKARAEVIARLDGVLGVEQTFNGPTVIIREYKAEGGEGFDPTKV